MRAEKVTKMTKLAVVMILAVVTGYAQEARVLGNKDLTPMSQADATNFWARTKIHDHVSSSRVQKAEVVSTTPTVHAPGVVQVLGAFDDDQYVTARFFSRKFLPGEGYVCVGWRYTPSGSVGSIEMIPFCTANYLYYFYLNLDIFKGYIPPSSWSGNYRYDAFVRINNATPVEVTGYASVFSSPDPSTPQIKDVSLSGGSSLSSTGGPNLNVVGNFLNPVMFYDGREVLSTTLNASGVVGTSSWFVVGRLLTLCDSKNENWTCTTQVVYKY